MSIVSGLEVFAAGIALGVAYCAMLWFAVRQFCIGQRPLLWLVGTAIPRLGVPLLGFYAVMEDRWERLAICVAGFVLARHLAQQWAARKEPIRVGKSGGR